MEKTAFGCGFRKKADMSSLFKGTAKMLASEGEKSLAHQGTLGRAAKETAERTLDYSKFNPPKLYRYKAPPQQR